MSVTSIDAALDRAVQQLSSDQRVQRDARAAFLELFDRFLRDGGLAQMTSSPGGGAAAAPRGGIGTQPLLKEPGLAPLEQLPELTAGDPQYNTREATLRERLNLPELERHLKEAAASYGVEYSTTDLEGILRNAGYDAAHLGSSDRYMAAIQRFTAEAENNYRQRASNQPSAA